MNISKKVVSFVVLLAVYVFLSVQSVQGQTLDIWTCDGNGTPKSTFGPDEQIYIDGTGFEDGVSYNVYLVEDTTWSSGKSIPQRVSQSSDLIWFGLISGGELTVPYGIWNADDTYPGLFDIVVEHPAKGTAGQWEDADYEDLIDMVVGTGGIQIVPELTGLFLPMVMLAVTAMVIYQKKR